MSFKVGTKVQFHSGRGKGRSGAGKVVEVREGARGAWFGVKVEGTDETLFLRAANLRVA